MKWEFDDNLQIHTQLVDGIIKRIIQDIYPMGERLPSVRELATEAKVNPNTMQKALQELEDKKIIETRRTTGKFVTDDTKLLANLMTDLSDQVVSNFIKAMKNLAIDDKKIIKLIESELKK